MLAFRYVRRGILRAEIDLRLLVVARVFDGDLFDVAVAGDQGNERSGGEGERLEHVV